MPTSACAPPATPDPPPAASPSAPGASRGVISALAVLILLAFVLGAVQRSLLCDDAFISFRYARHLVDGHGLVWNVGERVEGYTNFLWVLLLAAGMALGVRPEVLAPALGIVCGAAVLALVAWLGGRSGWREPLAWLAPAALALHPSFLVWSTGGLETQLFTLLTLAGTAAFLAERRRAPAWPWLSPLLLALATLTRPDGALFAAVAGAAFLIDATFLVDAPHRRRRWRALVAWGLTYALPVAAHALWRHAYYGDWLPNTFYAKVNGFRWALGLDYLAYFFVSFHLYLLLPLALLAVLARRGFREALFGALLIVDLLYLASVGGDFLGFRFLVPLLPYLYLLLADGVRVLAHWGAGGATVARRRWATAAAVLAAAALLLSAGRPGRAWVQRPKGWESPQDVASYSRLRQAEGRYLQYLVQRGVLPADLRIATGGLGAISYYTGWFAVDHHGLTDRFVAHLPVTWDRLGHQHNVTVEYLARRRVAVVLLSQLLITPQRHWLPGQLRTAETWIRSYNARAVDESKRLHAICLQPEPGAYMLFGTNLDRRELHRQLGHLPPCQGVEGLLKPVPGGLHGEVELPLEVVPIPPTTSTTGG